MANKISVVIDVAVDKAGNAFRKLQTDVKNTDGAFGKLKAVGSNLFASLKANAGNMAMAAGAAIVGFGVKAVNQFQDLAIEAGKLADALGMPVEEASRLIEVAGDIGIEVSDLESTIGRMNRAAAATPDAFDAIGASIARNEDGTVNVNETFLNTVDALNRIPDATKRAEAAQKIFGRSWMNIAEMVGMGADDIKRALADVSDAKVIDPEEVAKARRLRAAMDNLSDAVEDISLAFGEALVPAVSEASEQLSAFVRVAQKLKLLDFLSALDEWVGKFNLVNGVIDLASGALERYDKPVRKVTDDQMKFVKAAKEAGLTAAEVNEALDAGYTSFDAYANASTYAEHATDELARAQREAAGEIEELTSLSRAGREAIDELRESMIRATGNTFDLEKAELALSDSVDGVHEAYTEAIAVSMNSEATDREKEAALRDVRSAQIDAADAALEASVAYAKEQTGQEGTIAAAISQIEYLEGLKAKYPELVTEIDGYIAELAAVPGVVTTNVTADTAGAHASLDSLIAKLNAIGANVNVRAAVAANRFNTGQGQYRGATGAVVTRPTMALIGEAGPEAVVPLNQAPGASPLAGGLAQPINLTVNAGLGTDGHLLGRQLVEILNRYWGNGGAPFKQ